ncbi:MAG: hypothetical protein IJX19_11340 [Clostridia bacterium]|nr:hypothetical protein [Clostridia bacterium]
MKKIEKLDIVYPASLDWDWHTPDQIVDELTEQYREFGLDRVMLQFPSKGFESTEVPSMEYIAHYAKNFKEVKERVAPLGIEVGWWFCLSVAAGNSKKFTHLTASDGTQAFCGLCPLDPAFEEWIYEYVALFTKIGEPSFIFMEDDMTIRRHTKDEGCFCKYHLEEFARRKGRFYSPEELKATFATGTPDAIELLREWRELSKFALVTLSETIRRAVDSIDPSIPIGAMESGFSDQDGDCAYAVAKALAGDRHTPFSRLYGAIYNGVPSEEIPKAIFHPIYSKQHITEDFKYFFESDCFPHTRFFTSGKDMQAMIAAVYSAGYDGSTLQTQQCLDYANEDKAFGYAFAKERPRHEAIHRVAKQCELKGVEITFDPFYNTINALVRKNKDPQWTQTVAFFGIPFTTLRSNVAFWDSRPAMFYPHEKVLEYLSGTLFLDGNAAAELCKRGYGAYLGVEIGEDVAKPPFVHDACAREIICDGYAPDSIGRNMAIPHLFSSGHCGKLLEIKVTDDRAEVLTEAYTFRREFVCPAMTRFHNSLGGTVIVMGMTLEKNYSQSLLNYRRQKLFHQLITEACDEFVLVKDDPRIFTLMNEPKEGAKDEFIGVLTLINLSSDDTESLSLHLPEKWKAFKEILSVNEKGEWIPISYEKTAHGVKIAQGANYLSPVYLMFK